MRAMLAVSAILFVFAIVYWLGADAIPKSSLGGAVGADGLPKLLAIALAVLSAALGLQTLAEMRKARRTGVVTGTVAVDKGAADWGAHLRAMGIVAIGLAFLLILPIAGYALSVGLLLMTIATYAGKQPSLGTLAFGVGGGVFFYLLFVRLLQVPLPAGFWPSIL